MLVGLMAIFDFVAEQTANDDCAKVQLVRKKTTSAFVKTAAFNKWRLVERTSQLSQS